MSKSQEIGALSRVLAEVVRQVDGIFEREPVRSIRPQVAQPLEHAYRQLDRAKLALDAAGYAVAQAYLMEADGRP